MLKVGIIGVGSMGTQHFLRLMNKINGAVVTAVSDVNEAHAKGVIAPYPSVRFIPDPIELIHDPDVDAVAIAPLMSDTAATLVSGTDKVIVSFDTDFDAEEKSTFVGTGNYDAAYAGGKATVEAAVANGVEHPTVAILTGAQGDETHEARLNGYTDGAVEAGGEVVEIQYTDAAADKSATAMEGIMQKYQDGIDIVCATADEEALAAVKVLQDTNMESYADTMVCGFDGTQTALESIQSGAMYMTVAQEGYQMGYLTIQACVDVLEGKEVDSYIDSGSTLVDSSNVEEYIESMKEIGVWE